MVYTVKKLAEVSGVSVRTLHFYDQVGLLKPAYHGANGYRYYEEPQLLLLQQILFFRELGFELKSIKKVLGRGDFDKLAALSSHRQVLEKELVRTRRLIKTIDKTIDHLKGNKKMKDKEIFHGFSQEKQAEYEKYLVNRLGDKAKDPIEASKTKMKNWTKTDWDKFSKEWDAICKDLAKLLERSLKADSAEVQKVIQRHYDWLPWSGDSCTQEAYIGLGQGYTEFEWKKAFEPYDKNHPKLALFLAEGMRVFADRKL
jgi:MerR family transcriptional regulator, thiopeptide resistance regulator